MMILIISIAVILVSAFTISRIKESLEPPYTAGFDQNGIITSYYIAQNDLNLEDLEASLAKGVKSPVSTEVTTLFVTRQTRKAYENKNSVINPEIWVKEGRKAIEEGSIIYGIDDVKIEKLNDTQYKVSSIFYTPL